MSATAFILGVFHAIEPGHGKTALAARAAGGEASKREIVLISSLSALSHVGILLVVSVASHYLVHHSFGEPHGTALTCLTVLSSLCLLGAGFYQLGLVARKKVASCCSCCAHTKSKRSIPILIGLSIGIVPCPTMLAVYFATLSNGSMLAVIQWVALFGFGMALTLAIAGLSMQWCGESVGHYLKQYNLPKVAGTVSGSLMIILAITQMMTFKS